MIMNYGNEIETAHSNLSNCLYNSNWLDQPIQLKKAKLIFMTMLTEPKELVIGKLFPLNLETFTSVSAFDFNSFFFCLKFSPFSDNEGGV